MFVDMAYCRFFGHGIKVVLIAASPYLRKGVVILLGATHCASRNIPSLTAHAAHMTVSKSLISLQCHSYPS
jgi:hypothetical protein